MKPTRNKNIFKQFYEDQSYGIAKNGMFNYRTRVFDENDYVYAEHREFLSKLHDEGELISRGFVDERAVRAAAGIMMVGASLTFIIAYFFSFFWPIKLFTVISFVDFYIRVFWRIDKAPFMILGQWITKNVLKQKHEWVTALQKRMAWSIGIVLSGTTALLFWTHNNGVGSQLICALCIAFTFLETSFGWCAGCQLYKLMASKGYLDSTGNVCAGNVCGLPYSYENRDQTPASSTALNYENPGQTPMPSNVPNV